MTSQFFLKLKKIFLPVLNDPQTQNQVFIKLLSHREINIFPAIRDKIIRAKMKYYSQGYNIYYFPAANIISRLVISINIINTTAKFITIRLYRY